MTGEAGVGDQARRDGDNAALRQLAAPPVGSQELHELALGVDGPVLYPGTGQEVLVKHG
jgi:hypothetical protein